MARFTPWLTGLLIIIVAVLAVTASQRLAISFDWTAGNRNSLTPASQRVLAALDDGPITFTAYIYPGRERQNLRQQLGRYTRASSRVRLVFRDPARYPKKMRTLGASEDGAVVVTYQGRHTTITAYDEPRVTHALQGLATDNSPWVVFVTGHGERSPNDHDTAGVQALAKALSDQGMRSRTLNLAAAGAVPNNTGLLVIASPQSDWLPGEVAMVKAYVARGGALLWVDDPGKRYGLTPLAQALGVHWRRGTLVYPDYRQLGTASPAIAVVATYPDTPITRRLDRLSLFPFAGALAPLEDTGWRARPILSSATRSWLETGALDGGSVSFEPDQGDRRGPQTIGLMLTRPAPGQTPAHFDAKTAHSSPPDQRAVVIADSDFLDNGHLNTLGNRRLALAVCQWLIGRDDQIAVDIPAAPDARLEMAPWRLDTLRWLFVIGLPLAIWLAGLARWLVRRRR